MPNTGVYVAAQIKVAWIFCNAVLFCVVQPLQTNLSRTFFVIRIWPFVGKTNNPILKESDAHTANAHFLLLKITLISIKKR